MLSHFRQPLVRTLSRLTSCKALSVGGSATSFSNLAHRKNILLPRTTLIAPSELTSARQTSTNTPERIEEEPKYLLLESLTPDLCQKLTGKVTSKRFKLKSIQSSLEKLYKKGFPLPDSLTLEQWNNLMQFNSPVVQVYYLVSNKYRAGVN